MREGWGGNAPKIHWVVDDGALCGRVASWFEPTVDERYSPYELPRQRENYCRFCLKLRERSTADDILSQVFPEQEARNA